MFNKMNLETIYYLRLTEFLQKTETFLKEVKFKEIPLLINDLIEIIELHVELLNLRKKILNAMEQNETLDDFKKHLKSFSIH